MAAKRRPASKPKQAAKKKKPSRGRKALLFLLLLAGLGGGGATAFFLTRPAPEVPVAASLAKAAGGKGNGEGQLESPRGLAVAPNGEVYVTDLGNSRISVYGPDGAFKRSFGKQGPEPGKSKLGEFNEPSGVAVGPDGTVYVADAWNGRIQRFSAKGEILPDYNGSRYAFYSPRNVAVDRMGNLYVADTGNSLVKVIGPDGKIIKSLGGKGEGDGQFNEVFGLAINAQGEIFVADPGNRKIHKFSAMPAGDFMASVKVPGWLLNVPFWPQLACDRQGLVYAMDPAGRKIWVYDSQLKYRATVGAPTGIDFLASPMGLSFDGHGALWVSDTAANRIMNLARLEIPAAQP